ncbi:MAG: hypothetical protein JSS20_22150, partial [Proteobacteria bacterium]|nr:hypothetical protein [Pseudomonadota bacterium]
MDIIDMCDGRADPLSVLHVVEERKQGGRVVRSMSAGRMARIPELIQRAPIIFSDATGSIELLGLLLRETSSHWTLKEGAAARPHAKTIKLTAHGLANASALTPNTNARWIGEGSSRIVARGNRYTLGERSESSAGPPIALKSLRRDAGARRMERALMKLAHERAGKEIGIIGPKRLVEGLKKRAWTKGIVFGHHGAVAGSNAFKSCDALIVVGQFRPPVWDVEDQALALSLADPARVVETTGRFVTTDTALRGTELVIRECGHADQLVNEVLRLQSEAQQSQAYWRLRMTNRAAAHEACELIATDALATDMVWDDVQDLEIPHEVELFRARHGREPA